MSATSCGTRLHRRSGTISSAVRLAVACAAVVLLLAQAICVHATVQELVVNGGFETGSFSSWNTTSSGDGAFIINDGSVDPPSPDGPLPPYQGSFSSLFKETGPGTGTIYQDVTLPPGVTSATLRWVGRIRNFHTAFDDPRQQFRVEIRNTADQVLTTVFSTHPGDSLLDNWVSRSVDVANFAGQTIRVAFVAHDELNYLDVHLDNISLQITTGPDLIYSEPLDANPGWQTQGEWAFGAPLGGGGGLGGYGDPTQGYTGANVYGVNLAGNYSVAVGGPYYLTSRPVDCSHYSGVHLGFRRWLNTDWGSYVAATVQVSINGTLWTPVYANPASDEVADSSWQQMDYDISAVADGQSTVYIRWGYQVLRGGAYAYSGWNIDDIQMTAGQPVTKHSISGRVTCGGVGFAGVTVTASPSGGDKVTDSLGDYSFTGLDAGDHTITPSKAGYVFSPTSISVTVGPDATGKDFTAMAISSPTGAPDLADTSDSGVSNSDNITNLDNSSSAKRLQFIMANTISGATVKVYADSTQIGSATAASSATTVTTTGSYDLADGTRTITATQTEPGKVESANSAALSVVVDTQPPTTAAPGALDESFGASGKLLEDANGLHASCADMVIQPDGKIITVGASGAGFTLVRHLSDGSLDTGFGSSGVATTAIGSNAEALAVALQSDGRIVAVGRARNGSGDYDFALARYDQDGTLDASFGTGGKVVTPIGVTDVAYDVCLLSDSRILVGGTSCSGQIGSTTYDFALAMYRSDGVLDTGFGTQGIAIARLGTSGGYGIRAMTVQQDGRIVAVGSPGGAGTGWPEGLAMARFNADGTLDGSFGEGGKLVVLLGGRFAEGDAVATLANGSILVAGGIIRGTFDFLVARFLPDGNLDPSFGTNGVVTTDFFGDIDIAHDMVVQADGKIVAAGYCWTQFALARYNPDGNPDTTFGTGGKLATRVGTGNGTESAHAAALDAFGRLVLAGTAYNGSYFCLGMARYHLGVTPSLHLDPASDTGISTADGITRDTTPTFVIEHPDPYFRLYRGGARISADYCTGAAYAASAQPNGSYAYTATAVDVAGNESSPSPALNVTIDTVAPVVSSVTTTPPMAAAGDLLTVSVGTTDNVGIGSVVAEALPLAQAGGSIWTGQIPAIVTLGAHPVTCVATDIAGNTASDTSGAYNTARVVAALNRSLMDPVASVAAGSFLFKCFGRVEIIDSDNFWLDDGCNARVKVLAPGYTGLADGNYAVARGIVGFDSGQAVLHCQAAHVTRLD